MTEHLPYIPLTLANPRVSGYNHTACEVGSLRGRKAAAPLKLREPAAVGAGRCLRGRNGAAPLSRALSRQLSA